MKKINLVILIIILFSSSEVVFARVTEDPVNYGANSLNYNQPSSNYFLYSPKSERILTIDVRDLQAQIDQLNQKNLELETKLKQQPVIQQAPAQTTTQVSPNDAGQTQRIDTLEKKVGIIETIVGGLKSSIDKTLNLLTKLLSLF